MNCKLRLLSAGVLFFIGHSAFAQQQKRDTVGGEQKIEEVVVVAFGTQKKEAIVGSVATVDKKVIENQQATSVLSALQGTVAGVNVISTGGMPGDNPSIYIRGIASINASTQPLIIVDGSPYGGNVNSIPQDQVESMSILKDASATALYGSRAANGVIIITTKKGRLNSKPRVNISSLVGVSSSAVKFHEVLGAEDFMKGTWQAIKNNRIRNNGASEATAAQYATDNLVNTLTYNPYNVAKPVDVNGNVVDGATLLWDTDWRKELVNEAAFKQEHRFNVSGGSDNTTYFLGADYLDMYGNIKTSKFERIGLRGNVESKVNDWLKVGLNSSFTSSTQNYPVQSGSTYASAIQWIYTLPNIYPLYMRDQSGNLILDNFGKPQYDYGNEGASGRLVNAQRDVLNNENAVGALFNNKIRYNRYDMFANGFAEVSFTNYLKLRSQGSFQLYTLDTNEYDHYRYGAAASVKGRVSQSRDLAKTINWTNTLSFDKKYGDHSVQAQAIFELMDYRYDALSAQGTGYLPDVFVLNGSTTPESVGGYVNQERLVGYLGRAAYNYANKYFIEGSVRTDGSTRFAPETRWGTFYSVGAAWVVSQESFFQNDIMNNFKLKGSYGELGNNATASYFPYLETYATGWNQLDQTGIILGGARDYFLTWEKTASTNFGAELGFFNNRITAEVDYFNKESIDLIYAKPLPGSTGNTSITTNVGSLRNYGWEFNVNTRNITTQNFSWTSNFNLTLENNEITELTQKSFINGTKRWEVGRSLFDFFLVEWAGVDPTTGMGTWYVNQTDANGNVTRVASTDYNAANSEANKRYVGSSLPKARGGFTNNFKYGNFELNSLFNFAFGAKIYDSSYASLMTGFSSAGRQQSVDVLNAWQKPGDITDVPVNIMSNNQNASTSTRFLYDNDFIRLKALSLGYNVNKNLIENIGINNIKIYLQGENLWTWQTHEGIDPEQGISGTTDSRSYNLRTISLGFNIGF
ncbi:SusC/RagA family TonB-linked outer membrane protein [Kaistella daneshvariae]|uniref:SusC/RagA family TonB-linked outer membrane protein n=1 Tax=Kaistella daneshvariae TaxID=2487074 RepID=A0ABN5SZU5_9FLAO|nr:SusC/RagA family TonB-linked outer membrane protein [Kaistella daneshvariae]AZI66781.1 SusC/RagA family TonB-linked outer membrane protein [Kaistella daneshvariae]